MTAHIQPSWQDPKYSVKS